MAFLFALLVVLVKVGLVALASVRLVPFGHEWTVERFGRHCRTLRPGLNLIIPGVESVRHRINVMSRQVEVRRHNVLSADNAMIGADAHCSYRVSDAALAGEKLEDVDLSMHDLVLRRIGEVLSSLELAALMGNRALINSLVIAKIEAVAVSWGVKIDDFEFSRLRHLPLR